MIGATKCRRQYNYRLQRSSELARRPPPGPSTPLRGWLYCRRFAPAPLLSPALRAGSWIVVGCHLFTNQLEGVRGSARRLLAALKLCRLLAAFVRRLLASVSWLVDRAPLLRRSPIPLRGRWLAERRCCDALARSAIRLAGHAAVAACRRLAVLNPDWIGILILLDPPTGVNRKKAFFFSLYNRDLDIGRGRIHFKNKY